MRFKKYIQLVIPAVLLAGVITWAFNLHELRLAIRLITFLTRDLYRAKELGDGHWIFFGPEMTGGGHLPGPFYYFLLAAVGTVRSFFGPFELLLATMVGAAMSGFFYLRHRISVESGLLFVALFVLSSVLENLMVAFLNLSFVVPFLVFAFICILEAFRPNSERYRKKAFLGACFILSLSLQLHATSLAFVVALAILQVLSPRFGLERLSKKTVLTGIVVFLLPCVPYFIWSVFEDLGKPFGQATFFAGGIHSAMPSLLRYIDLPSMARIFHGLFVFLIHVPLALYPLLAALYFGRFALSQKSTEKLPAYFFPAIVCVIVGIVPLAYVFFAPIGVRYSAPFAVSAIFLTVFIHAQLRSVQERFIFVFLAGFTSLCALIYALIEIKALDIANFRASHHYIFGLIMAAVILGVIVWRRQPKIRALGFALIILLSVIQNPSVWGGKLRMEILVSPSKLEWLKIGQAICSDYGWSLTEVRRRFYFVELHMEIDPTSLMHLDNMICKNEVPEEKTVPDGFIVTSRNSFTAGAAREFLLGQPLADEIKAGIESGDLQLGDARSIGTFALVPYFVRNLEKLPPYFHNLGAGYLESTTHAFLRANGSPGNVTKLEANRYLMRWNECPGQDPYCETGALVTLEPHGSTTNISVEVFGDSLGQQSPWVTPFWTVSWQDPYLDVTCGQTLHHFPLAKSIGYDRRYGFFVPLYSFYLSNHGMLAPFTRKFKVSCVPTELTLGRQATRVDYIQSIEDLPPQALSVHL